MKRIPETLTGRFGGIGAQRQTSRVTHLGTWLHDDFFGEGALVFALDQLRRKSGQTVIVGIRQGLYVRSLLVLRGPRLNAVRIRASVLYPVC